MKFKPKNRDELYRVIKEIIENQEKYTNYRYGLRDVDTSLITDMTVIFSCYVDSINYKINDKINWNDPRNNITQWDVSNVTNMSGLFINSSFNQPIGNWNVSNVIKMNRIFNNSLFNQPLNSWNISNVTNLIGMFLYSKFNQPINNWDVSNVVDMKLLFSKSKFNQNLINWVLKLDENCNLYDFNEESLHSKRFSNINSYEDFLKIYITKPFIDNILQNGNDIEQFKLLKILKKYPDIVKDLNINREILL